MCLLVIISIYKCSDLCLVVWSLYSMFRYLYAFTIYENMNGQLATLGLGICAGLAFAFTCCSTILSAVNRRLLIRGVFVKSLSHVHLILQYPPSFCFLFPAVTNLVLLIVWKNMSNADLSFRHRCKVDVDLLWSITDPSCDNLGQPLAVWLILAIIRIVLSLLIIVSFLSIDFKFPADILDRLHSTMFNHRKLFLCSSSPM